MRQLLTLLIASLIGGTFLPASALAQTPEVTLTRLDCGTSNKPIDPNLRFNDTFGYRGLLVQLVYSCYLIKHGDEYMVWDAGHSMSAPIVAPKVSMVDQLAQLSLKPEQIKYIGISHYHGDHIGQVASFPKSILLIGKGDWDVLTSPKPAAMANPAPFANWISGGGKVEPILVDKDVFGDGTVIVLGMPGHTPGHTVLLVKLQQMGYVLLTGDLWHFRENYDGNGIPTFNTNRAETLASFDRFKKIAENFKATVIIQHDARDVGKLPAFPAAAR